MWARRILVTLFTGLMIVCGCSSSAGDEACTPDDADGILGVDITVALTVNDTAFEPAIIKTQNTSKVTLTVKNAGMRPHGFAVDCLPTPNTRDCPTKSCFPAEATIPSISPGESTTITFTTPAGKGIYTYRSSVTGDDATGQFVLQ